MPGIRERVRAEMITEIKANASRHLATDGANLSLRAVARDLGLVSSAIYRYFPSRDDLLTALIIDAYNDMGEAVEVAEAAISRADFAGRHRAVADALRSWSLANPPEYALLYGSPVPGYAAPPDTIGPASRPIVVLVTIMREAEAAGHLVLTPPPGRMPRTMRADLKAVTATAQFGGVSEAVLAAGMQAWAELFGLISFELFGRLNNVINDRDAFYAYQAEAIERRLGLR
ncbi:TetR/AcrR family transcriptional regulator [Jatrophihabitans telluris]|uniref:TetR/AcrR family transcriptional regulator n=1 Tax=Jatrophihabitans telluris TaxID=2038343 RepID=A0ABY4R003_9ACTN|nr:TetR/AcrR family transcriptional regulator [Jatrophihabitans telluris]UQX89150.1 TetR/AcrR family transcriptional regulator [Jatrophihabitans telluris]